MDFPSFLRCTRTGNCNWRCEAMATPGRSYCQRHYLEQKRRNQRKRDRRHHPSSSSSSSPPPSASTSSPPSSSYSSDEILAMKRDRREASQVDEEAELYMNQLLPRERERVKSLRVDFEERSSPGKKGGSSVKAAGSSPRRGTRPTAARKQREGWISSSRKRSFGKEGEPSLELVDSEDTYFDGEMRSSRQVKATNNKGFALGLLDTFRTEEEKGNFTCHQCRDSFASNTIVCSNCHVKRYCYTCLARWYPERSHDEVRGACPVCSGYCNCKACLRTEFKVHQKRENKNVKLQRLVYLLHQVLPLLRKILTEQQLELEIEATARRVQPMEVEVARTRLAFDERLYCDSCSALVVDFYRSCPNCSYDLCLGCCQVLRDGNWTNDGEVAPIHRHFIERAHHQDEHTQCHDSKFGSDMAIRHGQSGSVTEDASGKNDHCGKTTVSLPCWRADCDGSIPCPPKECGGCGNRLLVLKSTSELHWLPELIKKAEALTNDCQCFSDDDLMLDCRMCIPCNFTVLRRAAFRHNSHDNFLYCPKSVDLSDDDVEHFQSHWRRGEPVIVRGILEKTVGLSWEPMVIWRAARETKLKKFKDESKLVKAIRCLDWCEVEINIHQFFRGYLEGIIHETGWPEMFMLKDWPSFSSLEECLPRHCMEFIEALPFYDYTNPKYGSLNLANKFPDGCRKPHLGPKIYVAYGFQDELGRGDSVIKLHCNMSDAVNVLTHTHEVKMARWQCDIVRSMKKKYKDEDLHELYRISEVSVVESDRRWLKVSPACETVGCSVDLASPKECTHVVEKSVQGLSDRQMQDATMLEKGCSGILDSHMFPETTSHLELDALSVTCNVVEKSCSSKVNHKQISIDKFCTEAEPFKGAVVFHNNLNPEEKKGTTDNEFGVIPEGKDSDKDIENDIRTLEKEGKGDSKDEVVGYDPGHVALEEKCDVSLQKSHKDASSHNEDISMVGSGGAVWDIFRRQDVPKLTEYLRRHQKEFRHINNIPVYSVTHPIHDQMFFLNERHKRQLKEEYGVEPWTFEQHLGEAVFIPSGCPYQVRNRQSCVKVALDFVSPENIRECAQLMEGFRLLPKSHHAREDKLEVKEMALYAASAAIREAVDILAKYKGNSSTPKSGASAFDTDDQLHL